MDRDLRPTREDYVVWRTATTRWADDDVYGHMNNATYFELIDTAVNAYLVESTGMDIRGLPAIGIVAEVSCRYYREMSFPEPVELGLVAERVGTSSIVYRIGLFQGDSDDACAEGRFVHVYVHSGGGDGVRPVTPIPHVIRSVAEGLLPDRPA